MNSSPEMAIALRAICLSLPILVAGAATALPLLSEVYYDAPGSDDGVVFVEIAGVPGTDLAGYRVEGVNGSDGSITTSVDLDGSIPADGLFVLADGASGGGTGVANADQVANFDFQNGPDAVQLVLASSIVDALGYGVFGSGEVFGGEGVPAPDAPAGSSLARVFANVDSDDNAVDFALLDPPTPGVASFAIVPEPGVLGSIGLGLAGLAATGRRRRRG